MLRDFFARLPEAFRVLQGKNTPRGRQGAARVGILTITDGEFDAVRRVLQLHHNVNGTACFSRDAAATMHPVVARRAAAQGNIEAARAIGELIEDFRPDYLFLVGTAGGTGKDQGDVGDVVVADVIDYYEHQKYVAGQNLPRKTPSDPPSLFLRGRFAEPLRVDGKWIPRIADHCARPATGNPKLLIGEIVAGEKLLGDSTNEFQRRVMKEHDKALAVDMESWGVAKEIFAQRGSPRYNPQYLVVRGISDLISSDENDAMRQEWREYAAVAAAAVTDEIVQRLFAAHLED